jgi:hypothetical protein
LVSQAAPDGGIGATLLPAREGEMPHRTIITFLAMAFAGIQPGCLSSRKGYGKVFEIIEFKAL